MIDTFINSASSHIVQSTLFAGAAALLTLHSARTKRRCAFGCG